MKKQNKTILTAVISILTVAGLGTLGYFLWKNRTPRSNDGAKGDDVQLQKDEVAGSQLGTIPLIKDLGKDLKSVKQIFSENYIGTLPKNIKKNEAAAKQYAQLLYDQIKGITTPLGAAKIHDILATVPDAAALSNIAKYYKPLDEDLFTALEGEYAVSFAIIYDNIKDKPLYNY